MLALTDIKLLELDIGSDVLLLINAPEIIVISDPYSSSLSTLNNLSGKVIRIQDGDVDSEVVIQLPSGEWLIAKITQVSAELLELNIDKPVHAVFKSNAVILGSISQAAGKVSNK